MKTRAHGSTGHLKFMPSSRLRPPKLRRPFCLAAGPQISPLLGWSRPLLRDHAEGAFLHSTFTQDSRRTNALFQHSPLNPQGPLKWAPEHCRIINIFDSVLVGKPKLWFHSHTVSCMSRQRMAARSPSAHSDLNTSRTLPPVTHQHLVGSSGTSAFTSWRLSPVTLCHTRSYLPRPRQPGSRVFFIPPFPSSPTEPPGRPQAAHSAWSLRLLTPNQRMDQSGRGRQLVYV